MKSLNNIPRLNSADIQGVPPAVARELDMFHGHAVTLQDENGKPVPVRVGTGGLERWSGSRWEAFGEQQSQQRSTQVQGSIRYVSPGTAVKVSWNERGTITGSGVAEIADVDGLQDALDDKADEVHTHAISDVTGLSTALDGKVDESADGQRVRIYDEGTSTYRYIRCINGVLSIVDS